MEGSTAINGYTVLHDEPVFFPEFGRSQQRFNWTPDEVVRVQ